MISACISLVKSEPGLQLQGFGLSTLQALGLRFVLGGLRFVLEPVRQPCPAHLPNLTPTRTWAARGALPPGQDSPEPITPACFSLTIVSAQM